MITDKRQIPIHLTDGTVMTYTLTNFLGRGVLGDVFRAEDSRYVVKVPRDGGARLTEFEREQALLDFLKPTNAVPPIQIGVVQQAGLDLPVIVMPFYAKDDLLTKYLAGLLAKGEYLQAERDLMPSLIAFCDVMIKLHQYHDAQTGKRYTCTDRKVSDFYRINQAPIIIDWNVLSDYDVDFRNAEIRVFGTLIHEFYFGSKGNPPYEPFNDLRWLLPNGDKRGVLSVGLRYLMARMVQNPSYYAQSGAADYADYFDLLKKHLSAWGQVLDKKLDKLTDLAIDNDIYKEAIDQDIRVRLGQGDTSIRDKIVTSAYESAFTPSQRLRNMVLDKLNFTLKDAQDYLNSYIPPVMLDSADRHILLSHVDRWKLLLNYSDDTFDSRKKAEIRSKLIPQIGGILHTESALSTTQVELIGKEFERLRELLPDHPGLTAIRYEIALHEHTEAFHRTLQLEKRAELLRRIGWKREQTPHLHNDFLNRILDGYFIQNLYDNLPHTADNITELTKIYHDLSIAILMAGWDDWLKNYFEMLHSAMSFIHAYHPLFGDSAQQAPPPKIEANYNLFQEAGACLGLLEDTRLKSLFAPTIETIRENYYVQAKAHIKKIVGTKPPITQDVFRMVPFVTRISAYLKPEDMSLRADFDTLLAHTITFIEQIHQASTAEKITRDLADIISKAMPYVDVSLLNLEEPQQPVLSPEKGIFHE